MAVGFYRNAVIVACALSSGSAIAQSAAYPSKPVRVIVSLAAGSGADVAARLITPKLSEALGRQFIVDNRVGASGNIGAEAAARSAPDGYTLLVVYAGNAINQSFAKVSYALDKDFDPVGSIGSLPLALVVHPSLQVRTVRGLLALARARPNQLNYASPGNGSLPHLAAELFKVRTGAAVVHVPYKSTTQAVTDVGAGQMALTFAAPSSAQPHVAAGRMRILAVTSPKRSATAPEIPTMVEAGVAGYEVTQWYGIVAPAKTPPEIVARLNSQLASIIRMPDIHERLTNSGIEPVVAQPQAFGAFIRAEIGKWAGVVKASGAKPD